MFSVTGGSWNVGHGSGKKKQCLLEPRKAVGGRDGESLVDGHSRETGWRNNLRCYSTVG